MFYKQYIDMLCFVDLICVDDNSNNTRGVIVDASVVYAQMTYWLKINGNAQAGAKMYAWGVKFLLEKGIAEGYCCHSAKLFYLKRPDEMSVVEMKNVGEILADLLRIDWTIVCTRSGFAGNKFGAIMSLIRYMNLVDLYTSSDVMVTIAVAEFEDMLKGDKKWEEVYEKNEIDVKDLRLAGGLNVMREAVKNEKAIMKKRNARKKKMWKSITDKQAEKKDD